PYTRHPSPLPEFAWSFAWPDRPRFCASDSSPACFGRAYARGRWNARGPVIGMTRPPSVSAILWRDSLPTSDFAEQSMRMAAMRSGTRPWAEAEFRAARDAAPQGERWELVDGMALVTPSASWGASADRPPHVGVPQRVPP